MKLYTKAAKSIILVLLCFSIMLCSGCTANDYAKENESTEVNVSSNANTEAVPFNGYYTLEMFSDIEIGKSTYEDLKKTVPMYNIYSLCLSSGDTLVFPTEDGKCIYVKFRESGLNNDPIVEITKSDYDYANYGFPPVKQSNTESTK